jgi:hypothetical protein
MYTIIPVSLTKLFIVSFFILIGNSYVNFDIKICLKYSNFKKEVTDKLVSVLKRRELYEQVEYLWEAGNQIVNFIWRMEMRGNQRG